MQICIFETEHYKNFLPLVSFRPVYDLRCGIYSFRQKIENSFPKFQINYLLRNELANLYREENPRKNINQIPADDTWFINGSVIPNENLIKKIKSKNVEDLLLFKGENIAALFLKKESIIRYANIFSNFIFSYKDFQNIKNESIDIDIVSYPWDVVNLTSRELSTDYHFYKKQNKPSAQKYKGVYLLNKKNIFIGKNVTIKPGVVIDAEKGPIVIGRNVTIMSNSVIEGPAYIGDNSTIKIGAKLYHGNSIGEWCKIGGEVESSVIHSFSNKQHEGFLGHAYLGSWVNIGADTNNSDLKNNYTTVRIEINGKLIDSGLQFVGLTMGDHSKTGINMMFDTGTVVGVACNLYGSGLPPKYIPSFHRGGEKALKLYDLEKTIETMKIVMLRRNIKMTQTYEEVTRYIYNAMMIDRKNSGLQ
ncbi:MAG: hypothetical protein HY964_09885 [Ignavibacteriales bacterium]|nr:hypothetical protein [Ignavibacteriales bacterium]